jgi:pSer/pThr/pTyr-binding forkhead associated (FHA) protein
LDDALVSRRHARIVVEPAAIRLEDLGSVNGVYVNGQRVNGTRLLVAGDRIVIGKQELVVRAHVSSSAPPELDGRSTAVTLIGLERVPARRPDDDSESTHQGDALELLGGVADKVLALGRGEEAEKILASYLRNLLETASSGKSPSAQTADNAVAYAVKLAAATKKGEWVDYAFELFMTQQRALPGPVIDQLYTVLRQVSEINLALLRSYVALLRAVAPGFGPADRFLAQRVEGLERLAAAK